MALPKVLNAWKVWDITFLCGMGGIQFTCTSGAAPLHQPTTCTQGKLHFEWEGAAAMMHRPCCQQLREEAWKIHWMRRAAAAAGGGRERSSRLTVIAAHLGPLALLPPITNCTLDPTQCSHVHTLNHCKNTSYRSWKDKGTVAKEWWQMRKVEVETTERGRKGGHEKPLKQHLVVCNVVSCWHCQHSVKCGHLQPRAATVTVIWIRHIDCDIPWFQF